MPPLKSLARTLAAFAACFAACLQVLAAAHAGEDNSDIDGKMLRLLAPVSALDGTPESKAALGANLTLTEQIQNGSAKQPLLQGFDKQQEQALRDAFITSDNASGLADGLGSTLGGFYQSAAIYTNVGKHGHGSNISPALATLFRLANKQEGTASNFAKYFFADGLKDKPDGGDRKAVCVSKEVHDILDPIHGKVDVFGTAYSHDAENAAPCENNLRGPINTDANACTKSLDKFGNSRPVQTEPGLVNYVGTDYFGAPASNLFFLCGPKQPLQDSPSYPSGHTTYGYTESLLLAVLVPARYPQMIVRGAEYGNDRIILGAHYVMDVIGGRTLAYYEVAKLLDPKADKEATKADVNAADFRKALAQARDDLNKFFLGKCGGKSLVACAALDQSRFADAGKNEAFYNATQTYGLPAVWPKPAAVQEDVSKLTPNPGYLLTAAFPKLKIEQADQILTETEGAGGGFLDENTNPLGVYSRLDLYHAAEKALALEGQAAH